jgi:CubicO group peptidase (beta-lactamase class C family)
MPGSYGWDGGFGTSWRNDPPEAMTSIFLSQRMMQSPDDLAIATDFLTLAYQAIDD